MNQRLLTILQARSLLLLPLLAAAQSCQSGGPAAGTARVTVVGKASEDVAEPGALGIDLGRVFFKDDGETRRHRVSVEFSKSELPSTVFFPLGFPRTIDLDDVSAGGRWYGDRMGASQAQPFLSLRAVYSTVDWFGGTGDRLAARVGGGVEWAALDDFYLDLGADYTVPIAADSYEDPFFGEEDWELDGFAIRFGLGFLF